MQYSNLYRYLTVLYTWYIFILCCSLSENHSIISFCFSPPDLLPSPPSLWFYSTQGLKSLLSKILSLDPKQRPTAAEVLAETWVSAQATTPAPLPSSSKSSVAVPWPTFAPLPTAGAQPARQQQPAPVTPTGPENPSGRCTPERDAFRATVDISPIPLEHSGNGSPVVRATPLVEIAGHASGHSRGRSRKRKAPEPPVVNFDDAEEFSPEMSALGGILDARRKINGRSGGGGGERSSKISRVTPSPLTLPPSRATTEDTAVAAAVVVVSPRAPKDLLQFVETPPPLLQGRAVATNRPTPNATASVSPLLDGGMDKVVRQLVGAGGENEKVFENANKDVYGGDGCESPDACTGGGRGGGAESGTPSVANNGSSFTTISFTLGERGQ